MKRILFVFGLLVAAVSLAFLGWELWDGRSSASHLYVIGGAIALGLIIAALMADPDHVLALADRAVSWRRGAAPAAAPAGDCSTAAGDDS